MPDTSDFFFRSKNHISKEEGGYRDTSTKECPSEIGFDIPRIR